MNTQCSGYAHEVCARVRVPVYFRLGDLDQVWAHTDALISEARQGFSNSPEVDAAKVENAAHCIDFHNSGGEFQNGEIAFAVACAARRRAAAA